jgi:hypothetical protein
MNITKTIATTFANKSKKGNGYVIVMDNKLAYISNELYNKLMNYEISSVEFIESETKTESGMILMKVKEVKISEIEEYNSKSAVLQAKFTFNKLELEMAALLKQIK